MYTADRSIDDDDAFANANLGIQQYRSRMRALSLTAQLCGCLLNIIHVELMFLVNHSQKYVVTLCHLKHGAGYIWTVSIHIARDVQMWQQLSTDPKPKAG